jgi:hypothetical protein
MKRVARELGENLSEEELQAMIDEVLSICYATNYYYLNMYLVLFQVRSRSRWRNIF